MSNEEIFDYILKGALLKVFLQYKHPGLLSEQMSRDFIDSLNYFAQGGLKSKDTEATYTLGITEGALTFPTQRTRYPADMTRECLNLILGRINAEMSVRGQKTTMEIPRTLSFAEVHTDQFLNPSLGKSYMIVYRDKRESVLLHCDYTFGPNLDLSEKKVTKELREPGEFVVFGR